MPRGPNYRLLVALVTATVAAWSPGGLIAPLESTRVGAQPAAARSAAREHFEAGQRMVAAGDYDAAYREFESGYESSQLAGFMFNMAECALHGGDSERASRDYQRYLELAPTGSHATIARERLSELDIAADHEAMGVAAEVASPDGFAEETEVTLEPTLDLGTPTALPEVPGAALQSRATDSGSSDVWEDWPFWVIVGAVVVVAAGGAAAGVALGAENESIRCAADCETVDFR